MRTGRSLTVCCSLLPGGVCLVWGGLPGPGGSAWSRGVCLVLGGWSAWSGGCLPGLGGALPGLGGICLVLGGWSAWSGVVSAWSRGCSAWSGGVSAWSSGVCLVQAGGVVSQHALRQTPCEQNEWQTGVKILPWPQLHCGL